MRRDVGESSCDHIQWQNRLEGLSEALPCFLVLLCTCVNYFVEGNVIQEFKRNVFADSQ